MKTTLISALKAAGEIQRNSFLQPVRAIEKENLSNVVTEIDFKSEQVIMRIISDAFPSHNILTEESGIQAGSSEYAWVVDPLDGTSNFAAGIPWFGILIAIFKNGKPFMAGAYLPMEDKLFFAESGKGATANGLPLRTTNKELKNCLFSFCTDFTEDNTYLNRGVEIYKFVVQNSRNARSTNSLLDFLYVAEGKFGGCVNLFTKVWDIAAPSLIVSEAGGIVKSLEGRDLDFEISDAGLKKNYGVIMSSKSIFKEFTETLK